jgi:hypothetical protein
MRTELIAKVQESSQKQWAAEQRLQLLQEPEESEPEVFQPTFGFLRWSIASTDTAAAQSPWDGHAQEQPAQLFFFRNRRRHSIFFFLLNKNEVDSAEWYGQADCVNLRTSTSSVVS